MTSGALDKYANNTAIDQFHAKTQFMQFGRKEGAVQGTNSYSFYTVDAISGTVAGATLTEGTTPTEDSLNLTEVNVTYTELGKFVTLSNRMFKASPVDAVGAASRELGGIMAELADYFIQDAIDAGTNVIYASVDHTSTATLDSTDLLTAPYVAQARTLLKKNSAPTFEGGAYVAIVHPDPLYDVMQDTSGAGFLEASKYMAPEKIFKGEVGKLNGVRYVESENVQIQTDAGATTTDVYYTFVLGENAYGVVMEEELNTVLTLPGSAGSADPLRQRGTVGARLTLGCKLLKEDAIVRIESAASLGSN